MDFELNDNCYFGVLRDYSNLSYNSMKEFIENHISNHPNKALLLQNLSDLYVLIALKRSYNYWKNILDKEYLNLLEQNGSYIVGYILVNNNLKTKVEDKEFHYIYLIDTRVRGHNYAYSMMHFYEQYWNYKVWIIPDEIIESSVEYWRKYFRKRWYISSKKNLKDFIKFNNLYVKWNI